MQDFVVFCDLDGVIVDNLKGSSQLLGVDLEDKSIRQWMKDNDGYISKMVGDGKYWSAVEKAGQLWWENLEPYPWSVDLVNELKKVSEVCFLTSPGRSPYAAAGKVKWIKHHFPKMDRNYIITQSKEFCARPGTLLVDDLDKFLKRFIDKGGNGYKWPMALSILDGDIPIAEVFKDLTETVKKLKAGDKK